MPWGIIALASVTGAAGGALGLHIGHYITTWYVDFRGASGILTMEMCFIWAVWGVGLMMLSGLLCGAEFGRGFSYVLAFSVGGFLWPLVCLLLILSGARVGREFFVMGWFLVIATVGFCGGMLLDWIAQGYGRRSRIWAVGGIIAMLLVGWCMLNAMQNRSFDLRIKDILIWMFPCLIFGGSVGAVVGAIIDRVTGRTWS